MTHEDLKPPDRYKVLNTIQVMLVPISVGAAIILGPTHVPELILIASYTFASGKLAVLVFRKVAGLLPPPKI